MEVDEDDADESADAGVVSSAEAGVEADAAAPGDEGLMQGSGRSPNGDTFRDASSSAMETNDLGFVASLLFVLVPTIFLLILYIQTNSRQG